MIISPPKPHNGCNHFLLNFEVHLFSFLNMTMPPKSRPFQLVTSFSPGVSTAENKEQECLQQTQRWSAEKTHGRSRGQEGAGGVVLCSWSPPKEWRQTDTLATATLWFRERNMKNMFMHWRQNAKFGSMRACWQLFRMPSAFRVKQRKTQTLHLVCLAVQQKFLRTSKVQIHNKSHMIVLIETIFISW